MNSENPWEVSNLECFLFYCCPQCEYRQISIYGMDKTYTHLFNKRGGWNKHGGGAKNAKSLNVEVGINMEGGKI